MAVIIESSYGKTIGLPGYSSHKFCLSVKTEVSDLSQVGAEAERVYQILQNAVDAQMAQPGWVPNGTSNNGDKANGNGHTTPSTQATAANGHHANGSNGAMADSTDRQPWNCSPKQRALIEDIVQRNNLDILIIADLSRKRFGKELGQLNRLEASGLIAEVIEAYDQHAPANGRRQYQPRQTSLAGGRRGT